MTKILLTRHGHVEGIKPERFRGREPLELTARGRAEAAAVAQRIAGAWQPSHIYTSPMGRCVETAAAIAKACGVAAKTCEESQRYRLRRLAVQNLRAGQGTESRLCSPHGLQRRIWSASPTANLLQDLGARAANALRMVLARHADETIVLVGHDSVNRALLLELLDLPLSAYWRIAQEPCCLNEIDVGAGKICVRRINETGHLEA